MQARCADLNTAFPNCIFDGPSIQNCQQAAKPHAEAISFVDQAYPHIMGR